MSEHEHQDKAREYYGDYLDALILAKDKLERMVSTIERDVSARRGRSPIEYYKSRIKEPESMQEKLDRLRHKGLSVNHPAELYDGVGLRIVCTFIDDVYAISDWFHAQPDIIIVNAKDYIHRPKESGYRSYHLKIRLRLSLGQWVNAEIQLRTIAMDCWATLEHQLRYKKHLLNAHMMAFELKRCADELASTDLNLMTIRDRIVYDSQKKGSD